MLVYKSQGSIDSTFPNLSAESFLLVLQTEFQLEQYKKHASKILCIDSTHGTNAYHFKLITAMVSDDFGQGIGYPFTMH